PDRIPRVIPAQLFLAPHSLKPACFWRFALHQRSFRLGRMLFLASIFPGVLKAQKPTDQVQIPDQPTCRNCRLVLKRLAILGDEDGPGALPSRPYDIAIGG